MLASEASCFVAIASLRPSIPADGLHDENHSMNVSLIEWSSAPLHECTVMRNRSPGEPSMLGTSMMEEPFVSGSQ
jgi:hypothetical protein